MRAIPALLLVLGAGCARPLHLGYARTGYVVPVREKDGKLLSRINYDGVIDGMYGFCRGPDKSIYVASYRTGTILHYRKGRFLGVAARGLEGPTDLSMLPNGDLLAACSGSTQHLLDDVFEGTGALVRVRTDGVVEPFVSSDLIAVPTSLVAAADGSIYVGQRNSANILHLIDGRPVEVFAETDLEQGAMRLALAPDGSLYAASPFESRILQVEPRRVVVQDEYLGRVGGLAFTEKGELWATSFDRGELRAYDPQTGEVLRILAHDLPTPWTILP